MTLTTHTRYRADNLEDIAQAFEQRAALEQQQVDKDSLGGYHRARSDAAAVTWRAAAAFLRQIDLASQPQSQVNP